MIDFIKISKTGKAVVISKAIPRRILDSLSWKILLEKFGDMHVLSKYYGDSFGKPDLYANDIKEQKLLEFYSSSIDQWAIKDSFFAETSNPLFRYIIGVLEQKFDYKLKNKSIQFTARISSKKWSFPDHFDGIENFMFCLIGTREVDIRFQDYRVHYSLRAGDILYIPPFWYHHFWADNIEPCFVLNFAMKTEEVDDTYFKNSYPKRVDEIRNGM